MPLCLATPLCLSPHTLLCWIITTVSARDSDRGQKRREAKKQRGCTLCSTAAFFSLSFPLLPRAAGEQCKEQLDVRKLPKGILSFSLLRFLILFITGTECRGGEKREGLRARLCLQLHSSVSHLGPEAHKSNTHSDWQTRRQTDRDTHCIHIDRQRRTETDRWRRCHGVSGQHWFKCLWSTEIRGSTSRWSGSCTAAW